MVKEIGLPKMSTVSLPLNVIRPASMPLNSKKEVEKVEGKKIKRETKVSTETKPKPLTSEQQKQTKAFALRLSDDQVLSVMEVGVLYTSTKIADALKLSGEGRRGLVRHIMAKLAKDGKVRITEVTETKRKQFLYELAEK